MAGVKGRSGRPRLPTAIKAARGTLQPCRTNKDEPRIIPKCPPAPEGLDAEEIAVYEKWADTLLLIGVLSVQDGAALRELACADVRVQRARAAVRKYGEVQIDPVSGKTSPSGYARVLADASVTLKHWCAAFGVDPSSRSRVTATKPKPTEKSDREKAREEYFGT
jgi:P27 family predicted phage terminase small subunit